MKDPLRSPQNVVNVPKQPVISDRFSIERRDCLEFVGALPPKSARLIVTSPPYNIGKRYEKRQTLKEYLRGQARIVDLCVSRLADDGSICWQVGNYVDDGAIIPLDILLYRIFSRHGLVLRNRIVWHFEHGLHCQRRFSGRYETIMWFTRPGAYRFDLDAVRVPQKYPGKKYYKGPKAGQYSSNPLGKNPGDVWVIPNVKHNHVEKTEHPCQFPVELVERLVLALTQENDLVLDPYLGVGSTAVAALLHGRRAAGCDIVDRYVAIARKRARAAVDGSARTRPRLRAVYAPSGAVAQIPWARGS